MNDVNIRIRIEEAEDLELVQSYANERQNIRVQAITAPPGGLQRAIEPVTAVLVASGVALVAKLVILWWENRRGGLVVDMRPSTNDQIYRDKDLPYGFILIFPRDGGEVKIETRDAPKDAIQQLLEVVIEGAYKTVSDLAKVAKATLPNASLQEATVASTG